MKLSELGKTKTWISSRNNMSNFGKYNLGIEKEVMQMTKNVKSADISRQRGYLDRSDWGAVGVLMIVGLTVFLLLLPWFLKLTTGVGADYSRGERTGTLYKVSDSTGWIFKTIECEMNLGGAINTGEDRGLVANTWRFSVIDQSIKTNLQHYSETGERITVTYVQPWVMPYRTGSSGYLVTSVRTNVAHK
jgi:hypothetical protein